MNTELKKIEITEEDFRLVVSEKTLGHLTTNAIQIKEIAKRQAEELLRRAKRAKTTNFKQCKYLIKYNSRITDNNII